MAVVAFDIESTGVINDIEYSARGQGLADAELGRVDFATTFEPVPAGASAFGTLLSILIIPTSGFGRELDGSTNLLSLVDASFDFVQDVTGEGISVHVEGGFRRAADERYLWTAHGSGTVALGDVTAADPFTAVMLPDGPGRMIECITIPLMTVEGRRDVTLLRRFTFHDGAELPGMQLRTMLLRPEVDGATASVRLQADVRPFSRAHLGSRPPAHAATELRPLRLSGEAVDQPSEDQPAAFQLVGYHHVQLAIPAGAEDECRAFWGEALGLVEVAKPAVLAQRGGCWFRGGGLEVHLGVEEDFAPARKAHPGILVRNLPAVARRLEEHGHRVQWDPEFPGYERFYSWDLLGNRLEFLEEA